VTNFAEAIESLKEVLDNTPGASAIFEGLESGDLTAAQAYTQLETLLKGAGHDLAGLGDQFPVAIPTENAVPMVMVGDNGLPQLNPLVEAAIAELASVDGDVPHMRTGPLPEEATPAIPVSTTAANPVMVGLMLQEASERIQEAIQLAVGERAKAIALLEEEATEQGLVVRTEDLPAPVIGVENYRAGEAPAPMVVAQPTTHELASLTPSQRRTAAHKALATTQGRTSLAPVIATMLQDRLSKAGITTSLGSLPKGEEEVAWAMNTYADDEIHEDFSPVEAAVGSLTAKIKQRNPKATPLVLQVFPFNGTSDRHFGWVARFKETP
jgi:hypothetical protein